MLRLSIMVSSYLLYSLFLSLDSPRVDGTGDGEQLELLDKETLRDDANIGVRGD